MRVFCEWHEQYFPTTGNFTYRAHGPEASTECVERRRRRRPTGDFVEVPLLDQLHPPHLVGVLDIPPGDLKDRVRDEMQICPDGGRFAGDLQRVPAPLLIPRAEVLEVLPIARKDELNVMLSTNCSKPEECAPSPVSTAPSSRQGGPASRQARRGRSRSPRAS